MTDTQDLRKLAEAATPGPWAFGTFHRLLVVPFWKGVPDKRNPIADFGLGDISWTGDKQAHHNAVFVASANPTTIIALLDALEAAQAENAELKRRDDLLSSAMDKLRINTSAEIHGYIADPNTARDEIARLTEEMTIQATSNLRQLDTIAQQRDAALARLTQDRDEWKDSTIAANENQCRAEKKASGMQDQRDAALARLAEVEAENERHKLHIKHIGNDALRTENAELRARLAELTKQEPVAVVTAVSTIDFIARVTNEDAAVLCIGASIYAAAGASPEPSALQAENANLITARWRCQTT